MELQQQVRKDKMNENIPTSTEAGDGGLSLPASQFTLSVSIIFIHFQYFLSIQTLEHKMNMSIAVFRLSSIIILWVIRIQWNFYIFFKCVFDSKLSQIHRQHFNFFVISFKKSIDTQKNKSNSKLSD